jgi:hypothetical protein
MEVEMREPDAPVLTRTHRVPYMTEFAIVTTLALIAAPIVLVGATLAAAAKKRLSQREDPETARR